MGAAVRRSYDHRVRELVYESGSLQLAAMAGMPRSTARSLLRRGVRPVVSLDVVSRRERELQAEVLKLTEQRNRMLALVRLLFAFVQAMGAKIEHERLPEGDRKATLLRSIERAESVVGLSCALRAIGLAPSRFHGWRRSEKECGLDDVSSCPKTSPSQLRPVEIRAMHAMVVDPAYRHVPVSNLAVLAQRMGTVFASATTWWKVIREKGWLRPRERIHPESPKEGIRATHPNEYWHIDVTVLRLISGRRVRLQAVIDNFSRKILAWRVMPMSEPRITRELLLEAAKLLPPGAEPPTVVADSGIENVNAEVDGLVDTNVIRRVLAQVDVVYSNSMIEAWWRSLKHQWLFLNTLDTIGAVQKHVAFYVHEHNTVIPHSALGGLTPDEVYFGTGTDMGARLAAARLKAQQDRLAANRAASCGSCSDGAEVKREPKIPFISRVVQLRALESGMSP